MQKNMQKTKSVVGLINNTREEKQRRAGDLQRAQQERASALVNQRVNNLRLKHTLEENRNLA